MDFKDKLGNLPWCQVELTACLVRQCCQLFQPQINILCIKSPYHQQQKWHTVKDRLCPGLQRLGCYLKLEHNPYPKIFWIARKARVIQDLVRRGKTNLWQILAGLDNSAREPSLEALVKSQIKTCDCVYSESWMSSSVSDAITRAKNIYLEYTKMIVPASLFS